LSPPQPANTTTAITPAIDRLRVTSRPANVRRAGGEGLTGRPVQCQRPVNHRSRMC
jgi:hypothetical protein